MENPYFTLNILPDMEGRTVGTLLRRELSLSGTVIKRLKRHPAGLLLDAQPTAVNVCVRAGQTLQAAVRALEEPLLVPAAGPLSVCYEDPDLLVLDKRPGIPVHPGPGHYADSLGNFLSYYYQTQGLSIGFHPVNRLDRGTSGLLVVAKHAHAHEKLKTQLHTGSFFRSYLAICEGIPTPRCGTIDAPIVRSECSVLKREVSSTGPEARTHYRVLTSVGQRALVKLTLDTGRTHQIRVHMAYLGHPLTGDFLYGLEAPQLISRPALHAHALSFHHPFTGADLTFQSPVPNDMRALLD